MLFNCCRLKSLPMLFQPTPADEGGRCWTAGGTLACTYWFQPTPADDGGRCREQQMMLAREQMYQPTPADDGGRCASEATCATQSA